MPFTSVGKRNRLPKPCRIPRKHPHGRGEECLTMRRKLLLKETPPRAWGRGTVSDTRFITLGNTPTGVGKSARGILCRNLCQKHPHGRGEEDRSAENAAFSVETPPRAWGRVTNSWIRTQNDGTTPTGVGKSGVVLFVLCLCRKHPHGRGEEPQILH